MQWTSPLQNLCTLGMLLALTGCQPPTSEQPSESKASLDKVASATSPIPDEKTNGEKTKHLEALDLQKLLCQDKTLCRIKNTWSAGLDDAKQPMQVIEVTTNSKLTDLVTKDPYYFHEDRDEDCEPLEYWFVRPTLIQDNARDARPALLLKRCVGYDPSSVSEEDQIIVAPRSFSFATSSGNIEIDYTQTTIELPSLQLAKITSGTWHRHDLDTSNATWDWQKMVGQNNGFHPGCEDNQRSETNSNNDDNFSYQPIIIASLPDTFRTTGWKKSTLGSCSTTVTSHGNAPSNTHNTGYVTYGKPAQSSNTLTTTPDASFKVIMASPTEMFVEITDDKLIQQASSILHTDHLELWLRTEPLCPKPNPEPKKQTLFQFGITLDGKVHPFYGKAPQSPTAESVITQNPNGTHTARFKIILPAQYDRLTLVYSDSDDGKTQKRLIATSDLKFKNQFTLGETILIPPTRGTCHTQNNTLEYRSIPQQPTSPVIQ